MKSKHIWQFARIINIESVTDNVKAFELKPESDVVEHYGAGSHINLEVLVENQIQNRSYSLVGLPNGQSYKIAVKRLQPGRGGSTYMFNLNIGDRLKISYPLNNFEPYRHIPGQEANQVVLIAAGIGITPIYTIAQAFKTNEINCQLHYAARTAADLCFAEDLKQILGSDLHLYLSENQSRLNLNQLLGQLPQNTVVYFCGPNLMLEQARKTWQQLNRPQENFRFESFGSSGQFPAEAFQVILPRLDKIIEVPENRSLLDALTDSGVEIIHDCKNGECGLCALDIIELNGTVDHRDVFFSDKEKAENSQLCACVSRVVGGSVTLDTADRPDNLP